MKELFNKCSRTFSIGLQKGIAQALRELKSRKIISDFDEIKTGWYTAYKGDKSFDLTNGVDTYEVIVLPAVDDSGIAISNPKKLNAIVCHIKDLDEAVNTIMKSI